MQTIAVTGPWLSRRHPAIIGLTLGSAVEVYDFVLFGFFAIQIGQTFFPGHDPFVSLMSALATFAVGFAGRPIGAWWLGRMADRRGRKPALTLAMLLMGVGVAGLALSPGYAAIGVAAPVIAVTARFVQGIATGGEIGVATCSLAELAPPERRGQYIALQNFAQGISLLLAPLAGLLTSLAVGPQALAAWGWRLPMIAGLAIVPIALVLRTALPETHGRALAQGAPDAPRPVGPIEPGVVRTVMCGLGYASCATMLTYSNQYIATFAQASLHLSPSVGLAAAAIGGLFAVPATLIGGYCSDRLGRKVPFFWGFAALLVAQVPLLHWAIAQPGLLSLGIGAMLTGVFFGIGGTVLVLIAESLPKARRGLLFGMVYTMPVVVFGSTTQMWLTWLLHVSASPMVFAWVRMAMIIGALAFGAGLREVPGLRRPVPALA